jgi:hypothetical protein
MELWMNDDDSDRSVCKIVIEGKGDFGGEASQVNAPSSSFPFFLSLFVCFLDDG